MLRNVLLGTGLALILMFVANSARAFGVYAELPLNYTFKECTQDCSYNPSGIKAGVILPGNVGLGAEAYQISANNGATTVDFNFLDVSYLLPIPVINLMLGAGVGTVKMESGATSDSGTGSQMWASLGFSIMPLLGLQVGYHAVKASVDTTGGTNDLGGTMLSFGVLLNF